MAQLVHTENFEEKINNPLFVDQLENKHNEDETVENFLCDLELGPYGTNNNVSRGQSPKIQEHQRTSLMEFPDENRKRLFTNVFNKQLTFVNKQLNENPALTTCTDIQGVTALEKAVQSRTIDLVKIFLKNANDENKDEIIQHTMLYAIKEDCLSTVKYLLGIIKDRRNKLGRQASGMSELSKQIPGFVDAEFSSYITPIVLAAKMERLEIIKTLQDNGASEIHSRTVHCPFDQTTNHMFEVPCQFKGPKCAVICEICDNRKEFKMNQDLDKSRRLLEVYKALSSPGYICVSAVEDPILEAFQISNEMAQLRKEDHCFADEYEDIARNCKKFACELLGLCRSTEEVSILLKETNRVAKVITNKKKTKFPRVLVALYFDQKEFIAHPYSQKVLQKDWYEGLPSWCRANEAHNLKWLLYLLLWMCLWPLACILFMFNVCSCIKWIKKLMKYPINKFITNTLSFVTFLSLLVAHSMIPAAEMECQRHFHITEYLMIAWIIGMSGRQVKMLWRHRYNCQRDGCCGYSSVVNTEIKCFDVFILIDFWLWIILRVVGIILLNTSSADFPFIRSNIDPWNPLLLSEFFLTMATVLSFTKLTSLCKAHSSLGPLHISLRKMIKDIVRFLIIFAMMITGFAVAICHLYKSYDGYERNVPGDHRIQSDKYIGMQSIYKTLFWNLFGYGEVGSADIVVNYTAGAHINGTGSGDIVKHKFTESVGYVVIGMYFIVANVILLNMLIAMMAHSYHATEANADKEWKFARTRLWMTYYNDVGSQPPPFNIVFIGPLIQSCRCIMKKCGRHGKGYPVKEPYDTGDTYKELMKELMKRYWNKRSKESKGKNQIRVMPYQPEKTSIGIQVNMETDSDD